MATFSEILADVYTLTKRSDLVAETKLAIKSATLKLHSRDYFPRDIYETGIVFSSADFTQTIEYSTLIPRFRQLKYIRKTDSAGELGAFLTILTPALSLDRYNVNRDDVVYLAGSELKIRSSTSLQYAILGCYLYPNLEESTYSSWIAVAQPYLIILEAARIVLQGIGADSTARLLESQIAEHYAILDQYISSEGF